MENAHLYALAADLVLFLHSLIAAFIVFGLVLIFSGKWLGWRWVLNPWFRSLHLFAIGTVALQAWAGVICPLTTWEMALRLKAGDSVYSGSFVGYWLQQLIYFNAPPWVFTLVYSLFALLVITSWWLVRPHPFVKHDITGKR